MPKTGTFALGREAGQAAFGVDPDGYHSARLPYPDELYDELFGRLPPHPNILEIGAGTGLVTEALLARSPAALTAIEPDPALASFTANRLPDPRLTMVQAVFPEARMRVSSTSLLAPRRFTGWNLIDRCCASGNCWPGTASGPCGGTATEIRRWGTHLRMKSPFFFAMCRFHLRWISSSIIRSTSKCIVNFWATQDSILSSTGSTV